MANKKRDDFKSVGQIFAEVDTHKEAFEILEPTEPRFASGYRDRDRCEIAFHTDRKESICWVCHTPFERNLAATVNRHSINLGFRICLYCASSVYEYIKPYVEAYNKYQSDRLKEYFDSDEYKESLKKDSK